MDFQGYVHDNTWKFELDFESVKRANNDSATGSNLIIQNKKLYNLYRDNLNITIIVFNMAKKLIEKTIGISGCDENISLPIDVRAIASKCGFLISEEDFSEIDIKRREADPTCFPVAQLQMWRQLVGEGEEETISGKILLDHELNEDTKRFSIAHELGHFVLREQNPIGRMCVLEACPGMYPWVDTSELMADLFAYALILPYEQFKKLKEEYESDAAHWPFDMDKWLDYLSIKARMPKYRALLAFSELKKFHHAFQLAEISENANPWYRNPIRSLEKMGYSREKISKILDISAVEVEYYQNLNLEDDIRKQYLHEKEVHNEYMKSVDEKYKIDAVKLREIQDRLAGEWMTDYEIKQVLGNDENVKAGEDEEI